MRKVVSLMLALCIILSLCACGNSENTSTADKSDTNAVTQSETLSSDVVQYWTAMPSVDEFGDVVMGGAVSLYTSVKGDFSNTATTSSELDVYITISPNPGGQHFVVTFGLMEYGNSWATYTNSDIEKMTLKTKIGDTIQEFKLFGVAPNGGISLGYNNVNDGDAFFFQLREGNDIRCIINIGSSQYNFTVKSANFMEACEEADQLQAEQAEALRIKTPQEALLAFAGKEKHGERFDYIEEHKEEFPIVTTEELSQIIVSNWTCIKVENTVFDEWWLYDYADDGVRYTIGNYMNDEFHDGSSWHKAYKIENGQLYISNTFVPKEPDYTNCSTYQFRKIMDGHYLVEETQSHATELYTYIFVQYDDSGNPVYPIQ
ncbi:MAG: hypothetical protein IJ001_07445 [Oscillospiraceae bacterium]|nr:hypothetical protein [Oscillospiraceae bacterium]